MPWPIDSLGYLVERGDLLAVYCGNHRCSRNANQRQRLAMPGPYPPHGETLDPSALDPELTIGDLVDRLACRYCGERKASIRLMVNGPNMGPTMRPRTKVTRDGS